MKKLEVAIVFGIASVFLSCTNAYSSINIVKDYVSSMDYTELHQNGSILKDSDMAVFHPKLPGDFFRVPGHSSAVRRITGVFSRTSQLVGCTFSAAVVLDQNISPMEEIRSSTSGVQTVLLSNNTTNSSFTHYTASSSSLQGQDSSGVHVSDSFKLKDPSTAFLYALVPGAIAHGAGHFYAGKTATGFLLLGGELVGAALILGGTSTGWGRSSLTREGFTVSLAGEILFLGSWIYDMIAAPLEVKKENKTLLERKSTSLELSIKYREQRLYAVWRF